MGKLRSKKSVILVIILLIIIICLIALILNFNKINNLIKPQNNNKTETMELQEELSRLSSIPEIANSGVYYKMNDLLKEIDTEKLSDKEKFEKLDNLWSYTIALYQTTNNPALYETQVVINKYIIANYPDENLINYKPLCFDEFCAEEPKPQEIQAVINKIEESNLPEHIKENDIHNLQSFMYLNENWDDLRADNFLTYADWIKTDPEYIKLGINEEIATEIFKYVELNYPKYYQEYISRGTLVESESNVAPTPLP